MARFRVAGRQRSITGGGNFDFRAHQRAGLGLSAAWLTILAYLIVVVCFPISAIAHQGADGNALLQAQSALDANQPQRAIDILSVHLNKNPSDDPAHLLLAESFVMLGQTQSAEAQYKIVLKHAPANYVALAGLGELYASTGQLEAAEPLFARAVKNSQHEPQLRVEWAQVLARRHRFKEAATALTGVPTPSEANSKVTFFRLKAAIAEGQGNSSLAASQMENALAVRLDDAGLQLATATAQLQAGNATRAATLADTVFQSIHQPEAGLLLLQAQLSMRADIQPTLASLRKLAFPQDAEFSLRHRMAEILASANHFADAAVDLRRAAELNPNHADVQFNLALALFKAGDNQQALVAAEKARELKDTPDLEGLLGDIEEALGDSLAAVKNYQSAAAMAPSDENHQLSLALEFIRHRNFEPAKLVLQQSAKTLPQSWRTLIALGMVEYLTGTKSDASQILMRAAAIAPDPDLALRYLGDIELDESSPPDPAAVARLCSHANAHPNAAREQLYCGALMLHTDYASRDKARIHDIVRRLTIASRALPDEAAPHCELGRAYSWLEAWKPAQDESEKCVQLNPTSAQAHYRLSQIYHHTGQADRAREEITLYREASQKLAEENEQHETNLKTFLYTIQNQATGSR